MELDTGAAVSLLPFPDYQTKFKQIPLRKTRTRLKTYTGEQVVPKGQIVVNVVKDSCKKTLPLVVVEGIGLIAINSLVHIAPIGPVEPIGPFGINRTYRSNWADGTNWPN